jgi:hypothetical protein
MVGKPQVGDRWERPGTLTICHASIPVMSVLVSAVRCPSAARCPPVASAMAHGHAAVGVTGRQLRSACRRRRGLVAEHISFGGDDQGRRQVGELLEAGAHREAVWSARWAVPIDRLATTPASTYDSALSLGVVAAG